MCTDECQSDWQLLSRTILNHGAPHDTKFDLHTSVLRSIPRSCSCIKLLQSPASGTADCPNCKWGNSHCLWSQVDGSHYGMSSQLFTLRFLTAGPYAVYSTKPHPKLMSACQRKAFNGPISAVWQPRPLPLEVVWKQGIQYLFTFAVCDWSLITS